MPRTKRPVRKQEKIGVDDDTLKKLNKLVIDQKNKIDARAHMELRNVELAFKMLLGSISTNYMQKTVGQLKNELFLKELPSTRRSTTTNSARSASHDDGYLTENSSQGSGERGVKKTLLAPPSASRTVSRRSRSADTSRLTSTTAASSRTAKAQKRRSRSVFKTPAYNKNAAVNYPAITPKVNPHAPLTVLRQPRAGEMVVSMTGSPVMVPSICTMQPDEKANCNILLKDGTMLSLQPKELRRSQAYIPFSLMDTGVLDQLNTLKSNLEKLLKLGKEVKN